MRLFFPILLASCATSSSYQTANVLEPGGWEAGADVSAAVITGSGGDLPWLVMPRAVVRVGLVERVDLGASIGFDGIRAQPKFQLTKPDSNGLIVSFAPAVRVLPLPNANGGTRVLTGLEESVLLGLPFSDFQAVAVVRSAQDLTVVEGDPVFLLWAGGSIGLSWQVAPPIRLMPEVGVMAPLYAADGGNDTSGLDSAVFQLGIGGGFGRRVR